MTEVMAVNNWTSNAWLMRDCARLDYLRRDMRTLDCTYGLGTMWKIWRPDDLVTSDIDPSSAADYRADFTKMPWADHSFGTVVFDPPYKLNGTPSEPDVRYAVDQPTRWQDRMALICEGIAECARVLGDGHLLVKCQDQVCSGKVRWQSYEFVAEAAVWGLELVDRFDFISHRPQPPGRRQIHARRNASQLLVFSRP